MNSNLMQIRFDYILSDLFWKKTEVGVFHEKKLVSAGNELVTFQL